MLKIFLNLMKTILEEFHLQKKKKRIYLNVTNFS